MIPFPVVPIPPERAESVDHVLVRFWAHIVIEGECWRWSGSTDRGGYGQFQVRDKNWKAHRWSYQHFIGPLADDLQIDHLCRNRACVNPSHLEQVTQQENLSRGNGFTARNARKTHCPRGHPYSDDNLRILRGGRQKSRRDCRECRRIYRRALYRRRHPLSRSA